VGGHARQAQPARPRQGRFGNVQPEVPAWNRLGYGNNAVEVTYVDGR
jgi:hypothetical protein